MTMHMNILMVVLACRHESVSDTFYDCFTKNPKRMDHARSPQYLLLSSHVYSRTRSTFTDRLATCRHSSVLIQLFNLFRCLSRVPMGDNRKTSSMCSYCSAVESVAPHLSPPLHHIQHETMYITMQNKLD